MNYKIMYSLFSLLQSSSKIDTQPDMNSYYSGTIDIKLVDLCDYYIFTKINPVKYLDESILKYALDIYNRLDISASVLDISINVTEDVYQKIIGMFGKQIRIENNLTSDDIVRDIYAYLDYDKLLKKWDRIKKNSLEDSDKSNIDPNNLDPVDYIQGKDLQPYLPIKKDIQSTPPPCFDSFNGGVVGSYSYLADETNNNTTKYYILYNKLFNVSIVVSDTNEMVQQLCSEFSEFEIILSYATNDEKLINIGNNYFNKRMYGSRCDIIDKAKAFTTLYELIPNNKLGNKSERDEVFDILDNHFIINNDPKYKIKATDLYNRITSQLSSNTDRLKGQSQLYKRLSSYFIEKGLTRKRYTDGIYYYGIQDVHETNVQDKKTENKKSFLFWNLDEGYTKGKLLLTAKEIEKQREDDLKKIHEEKIQKMVKNFENIISLDTTRNGRGTLDLRQLNENDKIDITIPIPEEYPFNNTVIVDLDTKIPKEDIGEFNNTNICPDIDFYDSAGYF